MKHVRKSDAAGLDRTKFGQFARGQPEKFRLAAEVATKAAVYKASRGGLTSISRESDSYSAQTGARSIHVPQQSRARAACKAYCGMTIRSRREAVTFQHPFRIRGIDRLLPSGCYEVIIDEEMIEGLSFPAFRRVATMIMVPAVGRNSAMEMVSIGSVDLSDAQRVDASGPHD